MTQAPTPGNPPAPGLPDPDLPSIDDMRDTLMFVWDYFFEAMLADWAANPGAPLQTEWQGALIQMRHRIVPATADQPASDFVELTVAANDESFTARATFHARRGETDPATVQPVEWTSTGDYEEFVAWMVPWVAKHVAEGGGWIDLP